MFRMCHYATLCQQLSTGDYSSQSEVRHFLNVAFVFSGRAGCECLNCVDECIVNTVCGVNSVSLSGCSLFCLVANKPFNNKLYRMNCCLSFVSFFQFISL